MSDFPKALVIDIETSVVKDKDGQWASMPWDEPADGGKPPHGLLFGAKYVECEGSGVTDSAEINAKTLTKPEHAGRMIVGHNLKFDAAHAPHIRNYNAWDTMIAEYILTAQQAKFAPLADLVKKYAPTMHKPDFIGENLALGVPPQDLNRGDLEAYLHNDLAVTAEVFKAQWATATQAQRALIMVQSTASLVYGEMEASGLTLDTAEAIRQRDLADAAHAEALICAESLWAGHVGLECAADLAKAEFLMTPTALSMWFYHEPANATALVPLTAEERVGLPKNRRNRPRAIVSPAGTSRCLAPSSVGAAKHATSNTYGTSDEVLDRIAISPGLGAQHLEMIACVRAARSTQKSSKTYFTPWLKTVERTIDRRLHPTIHSTSTDTGRTSSANPNGQNVPPEARKCITSRFEGGSLIEADFKQLEVCGLAHVSECPDLIAALKAGDDIHFLSGKTVYGWKTPADMDKESRRIVKTINFGIIYGGAAKSLAAQAGVEEDIARQLVKGFYDRFPGVKLWQEATYKKVESSPDRVDVVASAEGTTAVHWLTAPTGRSYAFPLEPPPEWLRSRAVSPRPSPTKVKNYPVQGFATGDIVPLAVVLIRAMLREKFPAVVPLLVVHDSILLDAPRDTKVWTKVGEAMQLVVRDELPAALKALWGIELKVPLGLDITHSPTWTKR